MKKLVIEFALVLIVIILGSFWWGHELEKNNFLQENQESLRVGVIFANSMQDGGWNQQQYDAFQGLQQELGLPEHLGSAGLLQALNLLMTREEFQHRYGELR